MVIYLKKGEKCAVGRTPYNIDYYIYIYIDIYTSLKLKLTVSHLKIDG